ncbi:MAG: tetratricopeptide repeat protein [Phycisphaerales bacterium]|nr:tetratricopeptide repeat protein [Planctomycetota bacterium]
MTSEEHTRIRDVFERALRMPVAERSNFLRAAFGDDAAARGAVERLLAENQTIEGGATADMGAEASERLESVSRRLVEISAQERSGARIGPYRLLQILGEGGFGSVWMAEQEEPVERRVALKVIKLGMDTRQVIARFEAERQALAMMDHPNIARVLDAGATEAGRPYFVMELVKGEPIVSYCDRNNLAIEERLRLFVQVCQAVQHAHTKGIIHRDIKPSNVLVSTPDGEACAKVIDFGIAKATQAKLTEKTLFTEQKQLVGTPEYMSPEQAEGSLDIDTRTDVYSLGVMLYELLTGTTPFTGKQLQSASYIDIQRIIREVDPVRPSTKLSQIGDENGEIAQRRRTDIHRLRSELSGDLDWITMKALEKDRARRYASPGAFAEDIGRFLRREAVEAAPPSTVYRVRKFVRRHRALVVAGGVVAATLLLGMIGTGAGLVVAERQRALAQENAAKALAEAQRAAKAEQQAKDRLAESEATVRFLDEMLGAADPRTRGKDVTVRAVLDLAAADIDSRFGKDPLVAARLHGTVGRTYTGLGEFAAAGSHIREAVRLLQEKLGADAPDTCQAVNDLANYLVRSGAGAEAESLLEKSIAENEKRFGRTNPITLDGLDTLALLYSQQSRPDQAAKVAKEVLDARMISPGKDDLATIATMNTLAVSYGELGNAAESDRMYEELIASLTKLRGPDHPETLNARTNYAWTLYWTAMQTERGVGDRARERVEKARVIDEDVVARSVRVLGEEHQDTLTAMGNLATVYRQLGQKKKGNELDQRVLEISVRVLGEEHPDTIVSLANLGNSLRRQGEVKEAIPYLERALKASRKALPPENPGTAYALAGLGVCLAETGKPAEGEAMLVEARGIIAKVMGEDSETCRQMDKELVRVYELWEKAEPGKGHADKARALQGSPQSK